MSKPDSPLSERVEAGRLRSETLAADAAARARGFVQDHPAAAVAGGMVLGALIVGALTRRRTAPATAKSRLTRLAAIGADLALAYAARAARAGKDGVGQIGDMREDAGHKLSGLADVAKTALHAAITRLTHRGPR